MTMRVRALLCVALGLTGCATLRETEMMQSFRSASKAYTKGDTEKSLAELDEAIGIDPAYAPLRVARGTALSVKGMPEKGLDDLDLAIRLDPKSDLARTNRCWTKIGMRRLREARVDCDEALRLNPAASMAWLTRAELYLTEGDFANALADVDKALGLDPDSVRGRLFHCKVLGRLKRHDEAIASCDRAVAAGDSPGARLKRADAMANAGRYAAALADLDWVLSKSPKHAPALGRRIAVLEDAGDPAGAIAAARVMADLPLSDPWDVFERAYARMKLGRFADARTDYEAVHRATRTASPPFAALSLAYLLAGAPDKSVRDGRRAMELTDEASRAEGAKSRFFHVASAAASAEAGQFDRAVLHAEQAVRLEPEHGETRGLPERNLVLYRAGQASRIRTLFEAHSVPKVPRDVSAEH